MPGQLFDVIVLGGGPAGTAAALTLCHYSSLSVAVIEKSSYAAPRIGETLSPGVQGLLHYLKIWDDFVADGHQPALGTSAAWGSSDLQTRDFIFTPFGKGWHLDRETFDRTLCRAVSKAGGTVWCNTRPVDWIRTPQNHWQLTVDRNGEQVKVRSRFIVDATGKAGVVVKSQGVKRVVMDRLVAIAGAFHSSREVSRDTFTVLETCEQGWWYSAPLPNDSMIVAFMSDADIVQRYGLHSVPNWLEFFSQTKHTANRLRHGKLVDGLRNFAAHSACLEEMAGEGWVAVGDTAASHDPLSSSGIPRALDSGIHAARAIYAYLRHQTTSAFKSYEAGLKQSFQTYLETKAQYYQLETRWADAPFWRRRQQEVTLNPHRLLQSQIVFHRPTDQVWEKLTTDLTRREYCLLSELCATPTAAHEVVAAFHRASRRSLPDQRVILALQNLLEQGVVTVV